MVYLEVRANSLYTSGTCPAAECYRRTMADPGGKCFLNMEKFANPKENLENRNTSEQVQSAFSNLKIYYALVIM